MGNAGAALVSWVVAIYFPSTVELLSVLIFWSDSRWLGLVSSGPQTIPAHGLSMVYLWSIPWSIYDLSQVFVGFRHFACVEQKNKQFLSSRPKAKKLVKREIDHR